MTDTLVFLDLETTGLLDADRIIEIAALAVNGRTLEPLDEGFSTLVFCDPAILAHLNDIVREMHTANGLLAELALAGASGAGEVARKTMEYLNQHGQPGQVPLAGSSVHFDRKFLKRQYPQIESWFHYRNFDVSTIKQEYRLRFPNAGEPPKNGGHRAMADCHDSIAELAWYRERMKIVDSLSEHEFIWSADGEFCCQNCNWGESLLTRPPDTCPNYAKKENANVSP